jgi:hypothetical protein
VVDDEGSRSHKAIAFISSKGNISREAKSYSELCMTPQNKTAVSATTWFGRETKPDISSESKIGDELWKK